MIAKIYCKVDSSESIQFITTQICNMNQTFSGKRLFSNWTPLHIVFCSSVVRAWLLQCQDSGFDSLYHPYVKNISAHDCKSLWIKLAAKCHIPYIYTKVCGHPFKLVDLAISAIPVADRCITPSTQPCSRHWQWNGFTEELSWHSTWHSHRMPPFQLKFLPCLNCHGQL
jgi:hypothetical protein